jgi:hypothetical protein
MSDLDKLVKKALSSKEFREQLASDPGGALKAAGLHTPEREQAVKNLAYPQLQALAKSFGHSDPFIN